jgi:hypothetical protein
MNGMCSERSALLIMGRDMDYFESPPMRQKVLIFLGLVFARFGLYFTGWYLNIPRCPPLPASFWGFAQWQLGETTTVLLICIPIVVLVWNFGISPWFRVRKIRLSHGMLLALAFTLGSAFFSL